MTLPHLLQIMGIAYGTSEAGLAFALRSRGNVAPGADRGSLVILWVTITVAIVAGILVANSGAHRLPGAAALWAVVGLVLLVAGLALRWTAILTLRRAFTVNVAIAKDQRLVEGGVYATLRHPAYTGNLLAFAGFALAFGDWLAWLVIVLPIVAAFLYRIHVEERALRAAFGEDYTRYARRTKRLVPFVF
jgi:protein-S-isoprenylcysteine O-methyltransferase